MAAEVTAAEAEILDELRRLRARVPQLTGSLASGVDGLVLAQDTPGVEPEGVAALAATARGVAVQLTDATGHGDFRELLVRGVYGCVATYSAGPFAVLTLLAQDRVNVGRLHLEGRRAGVRIGELVVAPVAPVPRAPARTPKPPSKPAARAPARATARATTRSAPKPAGKPAATPTTGTGPGAAPTTDPPDMPAANPAAKPTTDPGTGPSTDPSGKPTGKPAPTPADTPAVEPAAGKPAVKTSTTRTRTARAPRGTSANARITKES